MCAAQAALVIREEVDDLVCIEIPLQLDAVGMWDEDFEHTTNEEVGELLERARREVSGGKASREE